jgi:hypothetical protein
MEIPNTKEDAEEEEIKQERLELAAMLEKAKQLINSGQPSKGLELVVDAIRKTRGENAILEVLDQAKEEARKNGYLTKEEFSELQNSLEGTDSVQEPILSERGKTQIMRDAYADGSSFICRRCGALVAVKRKQSHDTCWCPALGNDDSD